MQRRLFKPLLPGKPQPSRPPRTRKERKRKAIVEEFDPLKRKTDELVFRQTPWVIGKYLRGWQKDVPEGHSLSADPKAFLEGVRPQIHQKLVEEVLALNGVKFQLALKVQLRKNNPDGSEEYTDPVLRHKQQVVEIDKALNKEFHTIQETLEKWIQRGSGWVVDKVMTLRLDIARYQPLRSGSYIPLHAKVAKKNRVGIAVLDVKKQR